VVPAVDVPMHTNLLLRRGASTRAQPSATPIRITIGAFYDRLRREFAATPDVRSVTLSDMNRASRTAVGTRTTSWNSQAPTLYSPWPSNRWRH